MTYKYISVARQGTIATVTFNRPECCNALSFEHLAEIAGDWGLEVAATGGIYLAGGMAARLAERMREPWFVERLQAKGRYEEYVSRMPVRVIRDPKAPLLGAIELVRA